MADLKQDSTGAAQPVAARNGNLSAIGTDASGEAPDGSGRSRWRRASIGTRLNLPILAARAVLVVVIAVVWEYAVNSGSMRPLFASQPTVIAQELKDMVLTVDFWSVHVWATVQAIVLGLAIGGTAGVLVALVLAKWDAAYKVVSPFMVGLYSLPKIALAPLMILWFGIGISSKVALVITVVFFIMFYNTHAGVRAVDTDIYNAVRMMDAGQWSLWRYVILPSATPWIFAGMRVSLAFGLTAAVVGELIASQVGLGNILAQAAGTFQTGRVFAVLIVLGVFGVLLYGTMDLIERHVLRWRQTGERGASI